MHATHQKLHPLTPSQDLTATLKRDHEAVNKDNNFIYNDLVPDFGTLEPPGKAILAKPVQLSCPAPNFVDLFSSLMPLSVNQAIGAYNGKKEALVNGELEKLREATHALNEYVVLPSHLHSCTPSLHTLPSHVMQYYGSSDMSRASSPSLLSLSFSLSLPSSLHSHTHTLTLSHTHTQTLG